MAVEIRTFDFTIPANTPATAPVTMDTSFPPRVVDTIEIIIPPGPNGAVGFQILNSEIAVIPYGGQDWIVSNNEKIVWPLDSFINSGSWQVQGYNTGSQDHTIYIRYLVSLVTDAAPAQAPTLTAASDLAGSVPLGDGDDSVTVAPFVDLTAVSSS